MSIRRPSPGAARPSRHRSLPAPWRAETGLNAGGLRDHRWPLRPALAGGVPLALGAAAGQGRPAARCMRRWSTTACCSPPASTSRPVVTGTQRWERLSDDQTPEPRLTRHASSASAHRRTGDDEAGLLPAPSARPSSRRQASAPGVHDPGREPAAGRGDRRRRPKPATLHAALVSMMMPCSPIAA